MVGQNALLQGPSARRVVTLKAETDVEYLVADRNLYDWFVEQHPHAIVAFILTTTCRQWRVAYATLVDILGAMGGGACGLWRGRWCSRS